MGEEPGFISGEVFTDGSLIHHRYPALRRAGWAFAVLDEAGQEKYACFGPLPLEQGRQSIFLAELWAIVMALQVAITPINIHTDCANILKGVERGAEWCTRPESQSADLWHRFWHLVQELGGISPECVSLTKVKAHATAAERQEMGRRIFEGNAAADKYAKRGAASVQHPEWEQQAYKARYHLVQDILEFHARLGALSREVEDTKKTEYVVLEVPAGQAAPDPSAVFDPPAASAPPAEDRALLIQLARDKGHQLVIRANHVFCKKCCRFAQERWHGLTAKVCAPPSPRTASGARDVS